MSEESISWSEQEYRKFDKGPLWYFVVVIATILLAVFALWQNNFFFGVFIVLAGVMVLVMGDKQPRTMHFILTDESVEIGDEASYSYEELEGFDVLKHPHKPNEIILKRDVLVNPMVRLPVNEEVEPKAVKKLKEHLPEEDYEESVVDIFSDALGF